MADNGHTITITIVSRDKRPNTAGWTIEVDGKHKRTTNSISPRAAFLAAGDWLEMAGLLD